MPSINTSTVLVAGVTSANVLSGSPFEFLTKRSIIQIFVSSTVATTTCVIQIGGRSVFQGSLVPGTNRFPVRPDDGIISEPGVRGERLFMTFTDAATPTVRAIVDIA